MQDDMANTLIPWTVCVPKNEAALDINSENSRDNQTCCGRHSHKSQSRSAAGHDTDEIQNKKRPSRLFFGTVFLFKLNTAIVTPH